jgi:hypothetical protein
MSIFTGLAVFIWALLWSELCQSSSVSNCFLVGLYGHWQAGGSPLSSCSMDESCRDILKEAGTDGWTPLLQAAERADLPAVEELVLHRANVKARTKVIPLGYSQAAPLCSSTRVVSGYSAYCNMQNMKNMSKNMQQYANEYAEYAK